jgi:hypothetical protein
MNAGLSAKWKKPKRRRRLGLAMVKIRILPA